MPHTPSINVDIEAIVREVIDRLGRGSASNGSSPSQRDPSRHDPTRNDPSAVPGAVTPSVPAGGVTVDARVVTAQLLGRQFAGQAVLRLRHDAIVTPAARDWLRERSVAVSTHNATPRPHARRSVVLAGDGRFELDPWLSREPLASCHTRILTNTSLPRAVAEITAHVARGDHLGILISDQPHAAVCLANRREGIRAVHAVTPAIARDAVAEVAANLLVVKTSPETNDLFDAFITPLIIADSRGLAPSSLVQ